MPKNTKHIDFYYECLQEHMLMPYDGLCDCAFNNRIDKEIFNLFKPTKSELMQLFIENLIIPYYSEITGCFWACGLPANSSRRAYSFTPLRQTIVLFMAAINNEL